MKKYNTLEMFYNIAFKTASRPANNYPIQLWPYYHTYEIIQETLSRMSNEQRSVVLPHR